MKITAGNSVRAAGFRATKPRIAVYEALQHAQSPLSVEELSKRLGRTRIDRVTLYRTLEAFKKARLVREVDLKRGYALFELRDEHDHHHLACVSCGKTEDFTGCDIASLSSRALKKSKFFTNISEHSVELFGTCTSCVNKK